MVCFGAIETQLRVGRVAATTGRDRVTGTWREREMVGQRLRDQEKERGVMEEAEMESQRIRGRD